MFIMLSFGDIAKFLGITSQFRCRVIVIQNNMPVNGKSLLSILNLDLSRPMEVQLVSRNINLWHRFIILLRLNSIPVEYY